MKFYFRRVAEDGRQINFTLGSWYILARYGTEAFDDLHRRKWGPDANMNAMDKQNDIAYLYGEAQEINGDNPMLVSRDCQNYIMTEEGQTFEKIS